MSGLYGAFLRIVEGISAVVAYHLSSNQISGEIVDDELIIVDLSGGIYYNSQGSGVLLWQAIEHGWDFEETVDLLAASASDSAEFRAKADEWIDMLVKNGVVARSDSTKPVDREIFPADREDETLLPPVLDVHHDLEDVLMLDPIHDFGETGWPVAPAGQANN